MIDVERFMEWQEPEIIFSEWVQWSNRTSLNKIKEMPGIYLIAHFDTIQEGNANPQAEEIIYIGESHDRPLAKRISRSGGKTYRKEFTERINGKYSSNPFHPK